VPTVLADSAPGHLAVDVDAGLVGRHFFIVDALVSVTVALACCRQTTQFNTLPTDAHTAYSRYRMWQLVWSSALVVMTTSSQSSRYFTDFWFISE